MLSWMQGWVNPLFLAQQESGLILESLLSVCRVFQSNRFDRDLDTNVELVEDKDSIQEGFIRWNSRRVPIAEHNVELLIEAVSLLLELGLTLHPQRTPLNHATVGWTLTCDHLSTSAIYSLI